MGELVAGGSGYIGSHMVLELLGAGEDVVVLDNLSTDFRSAVPDAASFVESAVSDRALVSRILREHSIGRRSSTTSIRLSGTRWPGNGTPIAGAATPRAGRSPFSRQTRLFKAKEAHHNRREDSFGGLKDRPWWPPYSYESV